MGRRLGALLQQTAVGHVVDVGANRGQFGRLIRDEALFAGRIDSYEPASAAIELLRAEAADDPAWFVHPVGLSAAAGSAALHLYAADPTLNSLAPTTDAGTHLFGAWNSPETGREEVVLETLDAQDLPDLGPIFLKLDTQGHDFDVLDGATDTLARCELMLLELAFVPLYTSSVAAPEALQRLGDLGFGLVDLFPISRDAERQTLLVEADALLIRR